MYIYHWSIKGIGIQLGRVTTQGTQHQLTRWGMWEGRQAAHVQRTLCPGLHTKRRTGRNQLPWIQVWKEGQNRTEQNRRLLKASSDHQQQGKKGKGHEPTPPAEPPTTPTLSQELECLHCSAQWGYNPFSRIYIYIDGVSYCALTLPIPCTFLAVGLVRELSHLQLRNRSCESQRLSFF